jgi:hypothetical protein
MKRHVVIGLCGALLSGATLLAQGPLLPPGASPQATQDPGYNDLIAKCMTPAPTAAARAGGGGGALPGGEPGAAPAQPAAPAAPVTAPAPAYVDYITPVQNRWGGCFSRLGVGDLYYDSTTSTVHAGWNGGALTWSVGPGNAAGTPADPESVDTLAGC